jgi:hypothetical protein
MTGEVGFSSEIRAVRKVSSFKAPDSGLIRQFRTGFGLGIQTTVGFSGSPETCQKHQSEPPNGDGSGKKFGTRRRDYEWIVGIAPKDCQALTLIRLGSDEFTYRGEPCRMLKLDLQRARAGVEA